MREIKFRAWDKATETMLIPEDVNKWVMYGNGCSAIDGVWATSDLELMQHTGLKDKNGKEIYEGDVVRYHSSDFNGEVKYTTFNCSFQLFGIPDDKGIKDLRAVSDIEVIGNIYEAPELLGEQK